MRLVSAYYSGNDPFAIFGEVVAAVNPKKLQKGDVLILWGGEDISPAIYGQHVVHARAGHQPSARDVVETNLFNRAVELGIPIIGVCRGAQLACALSGGSLYQHIAGGHHQDHKVETKDGHTFTTSSCHHQALNLDNVNHELLAWDKDRETTVFTDKEVKQAIIPEVVYLKETKTFAIQGHPEWMTPTTPFVKWCADEIKRRFF
jgi:gamma-glutamyl-gamma-aminobutyrate hydrolase PuuD